MDGRKLDCSLYGAGGVRCAGRLPCAVSARAKPGGAAGGRAPARHGHAVPVAIVPPVSGATRLDHPEVGALEAGYPLSALAKLLIVGSIAVAYVELYVRTRRCARSPAESASPLQLLTIGSAVGLLLFLKTTPLGLPHLLPGDYHFGERLVPWWSWFTMGLVPFWDYARRAAW